MTRNLYPKTIKTFDQQIAILKSRGLCFNDEERAKQLLQNISYYRMSGYWYPLLSDKQNHIFKAGVTFEQAFSIYKFDAKLRTLILSEISKIEVAVRTQIAYIMSHAHGGLWFTDYSLFKNPAKHANTISKIDEEYSRSDEDFVTAFKAKYSDHFPPSWITLEITSLGTLSLLYSNMKDGQCKRDIARYFGVADRVMVSWLHTITYIRNICAHHSRLWNKILGIRPLVPRRTTYPFVHNSATFNNKVYYILCMIAYWLDIINPNNAFRDKLRDLFIEFSNIDVAAMGFPRNWQNEPLWR